MQGGDSPAGEAAQAVDPPYSVVSTALADGTAPPARAGRALSFACQETTDTVKAADVAVQGQVPPEVEAEASGVATTEDGAAFSYNPFRVAQPHCSIMYSPTVQLNFKSAIKAR